MKKSNMKWVVALGVGVAGGWAIRSLSDSPQGAGVKLLEIAMDAKERVGRWVAVESERLEDMVAEARSTRGEPAAEGPKVATKGPGRHARTDA